MFGYCEKITYFDTFAIPQLCLNILFSLYLVPRPPTTWLSLRTANRKRGSDDVTYCISIIARVSFVNRDVGRDGADGRRD